MSTTGPNAKIRDSFKKSAWLTALLMRAGTLTLRFVSRRSAIVLAHGLARVWYIVDRKRRAGIEANLERTVPESSPPARDRLARATFRHFAGIWIDILRIPLMTPDEIRSLVAWHTRRHLDDAMASGRGVLVLTAHVGGLDVAGVFLAACGYPISVIVEDLEPPLHHVWSRYRSATGMRVLSRRRGAVSAYRALKRGEVVALVGDRVIDGPGLEVDFCGDRRLVPRGPAELARLTEARVVLLQITRRSDGSGYDLVTEPASPASASVDESTRSFAQQLTRIVRHAPDQWFVFAAGWRAAPTAQETVVKLAPGTSR